MVPPRGQDPAEAGALRHYYQGWKPTLLGRINSRLWSWAVGAGLIRDPRILTLTVPDHETGRPVPHVLAQATVDGVMYLVSMLGAESHWVRDVRAASGNALLSQGASYRVTLTEVPADRAAPILKAWCAVATSGRQHLSVAWDAPVEQFEAIAADYPVFRVDRV